MLKAADTSLVVAAFASWHETHEPARRALDGGLRLIEHCALETYSSGHGDTNHAADNGHGTA